MEKDQTTIGVFDGEEVIGFITVSHSIFGNTAKYVELVYFQVSPSLIEKWESESTFLSGM